MLAERAQCALFRNRFAVVLQEPGEACSNPQLRILHIDIFDIPYQWSMWHIQGVPMHSEAAHWQEEHASSDDEVQDEQDDDSLYTQLALVVSMRSAA